MMSCMGKGRITKEADGTEMEMTTVRELVGSAQIISVPERKWHLHFCPEAASQSEKFWMHQRHVA